MLFDLKAINTVLDQFEEEKGINRTVLIDAIEQSLATAYKKEYGKRGQVVRAHLDLTTGKTTFEQIKTIVDESTVRLEEEDEEVEEDAVEYDEDGEEKLPKYDPEKHMFIQAAKLIKKDATLGDELIFPLETEEEFGRIAAQAAKQVILQKIREAERSVAFDEYRNKEGQIIIGQVQRFDRGNLYIDLGRMVAIMPYGEQIPGERYKTGDRIRALVLSVEEGPRGVSVKLSRAHSDFLLRLFELEVPELQTGAVEIKSIAREPGQRSKVAVYAEDRGIDPVGALVGQRGTRVSSVTGELSGERVDIIDWSEDPIDFIADALSPAEVEEIEILEEYNEGPINGHALVTVAPDQLSLAIGRSGQNVRLVAKLTNWKIDIEASDTPSDEDPEEHEAHVDEEMKDAVEDIMDGDSSGEPAEEAQSEESTEVTEDNKDTQEEEVKPTDEQVEKTAAEPEESEVSDDESKTS